MAHEDDVLRQAPLFEALSEDDASALRSDVINVQIDRGERLFAEGDAGDKLYIILNGKIKLTRAAPDGRENLLSVHGPGEMFGELSLFDPSPRTSSATAVTDATLAGLAHDDLRTLLSARPEVAMHMLRALAQRLRRINDVKADLVFTDVPGRVAKALLDLGSRFGVQQDERPAGQPRPDPGGAGPARRRVAGDGEQGAGRLRGSRLDPARGQVGAAGRHRPAAQAGQLAAGARHRRRYQVTPGGTSPWSAR